MTDERLDAMEAGPEMDELVAELVMGYKKMMFDGVRWENTWRRLDGLIISTPHYSTEIAAAFEAVDYLGKSAWFFGLQDFYLRGVYHHTDVTFLHFNPFAAKEEAIGTTRPLAICRAALRVAMREAR